MSVLLNSVVISTRIQHIRPKILLLLVSEIHDLII